MFPAKRTLIFACLLAVSAVGAGPTTATAPQRDAAQWGEAKAGLQTSLALKGEVAVEGRLIVHLSLRNVGAAPISLGAAKDIVGWVLLQQDLAGERSRYYSAKVFPARDAKDLPEQLDTNKVFELPDIDLSASGAYPYAARKQLLTAYVTGKGESEIPAPDKKLTEVLRPGTVRARFYLLVPRSEEKALLLTSNVLEFEVAPPDLAKMPPGKREALIAALLKQFDKDAWSGQAAHHLAVKHGKAVVPALVKAVKERKRPYHSRMWLAAALADIRDDRAAKALIELLDDPVGGVRHVVAYHGPKQHSAKLDEAILAAAGERKDDRLTALAVLGYMVHRKKVPEKLLEVGIASDDPRARATVAQALSQHASDFTILRLTALLKDSDERVRSAAATTLGMMKRPLRTVYAGLIEAMDAPGERARKSICGALSELSGRKMPYDPAADEAARRATIESWKTWWAQMQKRTP